MVVLAGGSLLGKASLNASCVACRLLFLWNFCQNNPTLCSVVSCTMLLINVHRPTSSRKYLHYGITRHSISHFGPTIANGFSHAFSKQWCLVTHDWRNAIKISSECIVLLLYGKHMIVVIQHTSWPNPLFQDYVFLGHPVVCAGTWDYCSGSSL
jgi:hypothetical protein